MAKGAFTGSSIAIVFIGVAAYALAGPVQLQGVPNSLQRDEYGSSALADILARYWEDRRTHQDAKRNLDQIGGGHLVRDTDQQLGRSLAGKDDLSIQSLDSVNGRRILEEIGAGNRNLNGVIGGNGHLLKQSHRGLDSLSGATFGESKRFAPLRRPVSTNVRPGNFDEIDRSVFDRFSKRNIDEIDTAFDSFFKRNLDEIDRVGWSGFVKRLDNYLADRQKR